MPAYCSTETGHMAIEWQEQRKENENRKVSTQEGALEEP